MYSFNLFYIIQIFGIFYDINNFILFLNYYMKFI